MNVVKGFPVGLGVYSLTALLGSFTWALSHHNNIIAVGSWSGAIIVLNVTTGSWLVVLSGHTREVNCIAFSSDGPSLVSGSDDKTIKLWDVQTGNVVQTFFSHIEGVKSVSISVDCTTIASGHHDNTICLWDTQTGECYHKTQHQRTVSYVVFSHEDPQHLISISDQKVWQWDANGCQIRSPFDGTHVTFSSDGAQFVSCFKQTITIYDSSIGAVFTEFQVASSAHLCCFSPDNSLVAVAAAETAYCWDITTSKPQLVETFIGHTQNITSVTFSSSTTLITASCDKSVRFWQVRAQPTNIPIIGLKPASLPLAPIKSTTVQSEEGIIITSDYSGMIRAWDMSTGFCKASFQTPAKGPCMRDTQLVNGRLILVWYANKKIHVWDGGNGEVLWVVDIPWDNVEDLKISGDGSRVVGLFAPSIWVWSLQTGDVMGTMEIEYEGPSVSLIVSGSKVWAHWLQSNYRGWDFGVSGSTPMELSNISTLSSHNRVWYPKQAEAKDSAIRGDVFHLSGESEYPVSMQCDGSYLVAGY